MYKCVDSVFSWRILNPSKGKTPKNEGLRMYTFHAIDTVTGTLSHKEHLNACEFDQFMIEQESKHWACQVVCDITQKRIVYVIGENGQWSVHSKYKGM